MQCNIDQRGRKARLTMGIILDLVGVTLLVIGIVVQEPSLIISGGVVSLVGAFVIFEGLKGWCALRAVGIKTPM